jgi:hypothetical protein
MVVIPSSEKAGIAAARCEMNTSDDFNWYNKDDSIVVRHQPATAVYTNPHGEVVVRQQDQYGDEDDFIYIAKDNALKVAQAILTEAGVEVEMAVREDGGLKEPLLLPAPTKAAERARRYRRNKRDGVTLERDGRDELPLRIINKEVLHAAE